MQDVFTGLHARSGRAGRAGEEMAYLRACVINGCRSVLRRRIISGRFGRLQGESVETGDQRSAEAELILAEDRRQVLVALAGLPARRREVLVLRYWLGLSETEIAATLGISKGTVKSTAARGIAALAKALGEAP